MIDSETAKKIFRKGSLETQVKKSDLITAGDKKLRLREIVTFEIDHFGNRLLGNLTFTLSDENRESIQ